MSEWSEQETGIFLRCLMKGMTAKEIMPLLPGRTEFAMRKKARVHGVRFSSRRGAETTKRSPIIPTVEARNTTSLTAFVFGDPPPGRSALDQRRQ